MSEAVRVGFSHEPVMLAEVIEFLEPASGKTYIDATFGGGGHTVGILDESAPTGIVIAIDRDAAAIKRAEVKLEPYGDRASIVKGSFSDVAAILEENGIAPVDGLVADLGLSSYQLDDPERGFSFQGDGPLDMRMDLNSKTTAAELINGLDEKELAKIFKEYGEERFARRVARRIVIEREAEPFTTTKRFAEVVRAAIPRPKGKRPERIDPATRVFQALRIAVNEELAEIERFLSALPAVIKPGGRAVIISFHSLEDRLVKRAFNEYSKECICPPRIPKCVCDHRQEFRVLTRRVRVPTDEEVAGNPRARSARLRVAQRC